MISEVSRQLRQLFNDADTHSEGTIDVDKLRSIFKRSGTQALAEVDRMVPESDPMHKDGVDFNAFLHLGLYIAMTIHHPDDAMCAQYQKQVVRNLEQQTQNWDQDSKK